MIFWITGRGFLPSRSCEQREQSQNAVREIVKLDANSRLIRGIDVNVARQIMFPLRCPVTWVIPLLNSDLKRYSLQVIFWTCFIRSLIILRGCCWGWR